MKDLACDYVQHHAYKIPKTTDLGKGGGADKKELEEIMADADSSRSSARKPCPT